MSVLNQSGEEQVECPLCMEPLEVDDLNFFPCTCGYQICRFCWHRIRTDENGLCPACRKAYSENPADFIPLSQEQVAKLKAEKRQRDQQRKAKLSESRKHLASVRVVQRNLVFVVGLPIRLADVEMLKRHEYFGKFGKIHKVVINQSTSYAGSQGPSASAYVTYVKSDDALRAIQSVNNVTIDGRQIKSSLGTTKYCSHFMKNQPCPKPDCMYLHDFGDPEASFTKEQMHAGKHQEYEKKLHDNLVLRTQAGNGGAPSPPVTSQTTTAGVTTSTPSEGRASVPIPTGGHGKHAKDNGSGQLSCSASSTSSTISGGGGAGKENWPQLNVGEAAPKEKKEKGGKKSKSRGNGGDRREKNKEHQGANSKNTEVKHDRRCNKLEVTEEKPSRSPPIAPELETHRSPIPELVPSTSLSSKLPRMVDDNTSFFSSNAFHKITVPSREDERVDDDADQGPGHDTILTDTLPNINTTEDWAAAFGFARHSDLLIDDLGFSGGKREENKETSPFGSAFVPLSEHDSFSKAADGFDDGFYEMPNIQLQKDVRDALSMGPKQQQNGYGYPKEPQPHPNGLNGLDRNMSKFFMDFHKNNKDALAQQQQYPNGFNGGIHQNGGYFSEVRSNSDRILLLQQKQLEEQLLNISFKQGYGGSAYQNGMSPQHYGGANGDNGGFGSLHNQMYGANGANVKQPPRNVEDDLGFDPIQETQKAFAELMAIEQNHKSHGTGRSSQINGVIHNQNGGHLPPPPPGFVQQSPHMNSFGSKILPYLNMSNNQQQINNSTQNSWPSSFNSPLQQQQQKNISNTCNDWKVLDPAILSSSRHFPLATSMPPPLRDPYATNLGQLGGTAQSQQLQNGGGAPSRSFDYTTNNNAFSAFTQQLQQPAFNGFTHLNPPQNLNWFSNDINTQISSPPGFRNSQTTKQQEC